MKPEIHQSDLRNWDDCPAKFWLRQDKQAGFESLMQEEVAKEQEGGGQRERSEGDDFFGD
jgi:hypothetical protein